MFCDFFKNCFVDQIGHNLLHLGVKYFPKTSVCVKCVTNSITGLCTVDGSVSKIMKEDHQLFTSRSDQAPKFVFHSFFWCHKSVCGFLRLHLCNFKVDPEKYSSCKMCFINFAVQCSAVKCSTVQISAVIYSLVQYSADQCCAVHCSLVQYIVVYCSAATVRVRVPVYKSLQYDSVEIHKKVKIYLILVYGF